MSFAMWKFKFSSMKASFTFWFCVFPFWDFVLFLLPKHKYYLRLSVLKAEC